MPKAAKTMKLIDFARDYVRITRAIQRATAAAAKAAAPPSRRAASKSRGSPPSRAG